MSAMMPVERVYLLDTDTVSRYLRIQGRNSPLEKRILSTPPDKIWISIVVIEEALQGALRLINNPKNSSPPLAMQCCVFLRKVMATYSQFPIYPFDEKAKSVYAKMSAKTKRIGANDCKIAAIAIANGFTLVTCNTKDFAQIPGVVFEDWIQEEK